MSQRSCRLIPHFVLPSETEKILCKKKLFHRFSYKGSFLKNEIYFLSLFLYFPIPLPVLSYPLSAYIYKEQSFPELCMRILLFLSDLMIPLLFFYIIGFGLLMKKYIYNDFVTGAFDGLKTVVKIMPTLIGLMTGVGILRASGFLDTLASLLENLLKPTGFPSALVPLSIVKMFSSSAATSLLLDLYKQYGPDSTTGLTASLILSSTETIFYTLSVYYIAAKVQKTRYTLPGALLATFSGIIASTIIANLM